MRSVAWLLPRQPWLKAASHNLIAMTHKTIKFIILSIFFAGSVGLPLLVFCGESTPFPKKPEGRNCDLVTPPMDAGEEGGHGYLFQVSPRAKDIDNQYSGCQAVFWTTAKEPARLAWLVEVIKGDPVRRWSLDPAMREISKCVYSGGVLMEGAPDLCPVPPELLMPSQAPGCFSSPNSTGHCAYDLE